jgi:hypothetical protein
MLGIDAGRDQRIPLELMDLAGVRLGHPRVTNLSCHIYVMQHGSRVPAAIDEDVT